MTFDYTALKNNTISQIAYFGRTVTYRIYNSGEYDPITGTTSGQSTEDVSVVAVVSSAKIQKIDDSIIQRGDKFFLIAGDQVTPDKRDKIIDGEETYQVISIEEIKPADEILAYKIQGRK